MGGGEGGLALISRHRLCFGELFFTLDAALLYIYTYICTYY